MDAAPRPCRVTPLARIIDVGPRTSRGSLDFARPLAMRLVVAIIQPTKLHVVREALVRIGVTRMTVCDAQGYARQRGQTATYRGNEYRTNLLR